MLMKFLVPLASRNGASLGRIIRMIARIKNKYSRFLFFLNSFKFSLMFFFFLTPTKPICDTSRFLSDEERSVFASLINAL